MSTILNQNITLAGRFNTSLIEPGWLKSKKIISGDIKSFYNIVDGVFTFQNTNTGINWRISNTKFVIFPVTIGEDFTSAKLKFVSEIFKILQYTPVIAVGYNIEVLVSEKTISKIKELFSTIHLTIDDLTQNTEKHQESVITTVYNWDDYRVEMILSTEENKYKIKCNFEKRQIGTEEKMCKEIDLFIDNFKKFQDYIIGISEGVKNV